MSPRGFEPRTSRSSAESSDQLMNIVYHSNVGSQGVPISDKLVVSWKLLEEFAKWLRWQRVSEYAIKYHYLSYIKRLVGFVFKDRKSVNEAFSIMGFNKTS